MRKLKKFQKLILSGLIIMCSGILASSLLTGFVLLQIICFIVTFTGVGIASWGVLISDKGEE